MKKAYTIWTCTAVTKCLGNLHIPWAPGFPDRLKHNTNQRKLANRDSQYPFQSVSSEGDFELSCQWTYSHIPTPVQYSPRACWPCDSLCNSFFRYNRIVAIASIGSHMRHVQYDVCSIQNGSSCTVYEQVMLWCITYNIFSCDVIEKWWRVIHVSCEMSVFSSERFFLYRDLP